MANGINYKIKAMGCEGIMMLKYIKPKIDLYKSQLLGEFFIILN